MTNFRLNRWFTIVMVVLLLRAGLQGQLIGPTLSTAYDLFHIAFGVIALVAVFVQRGKYCACFNLIFGAMDVYQGFAYSFAVFPSQLFALNLFDTVVHYLLGAALFVVGWLGVRKQMAQTLSPTPDYLRFSDLNHEAHKEGTKHTKNLG